MNWQTIRTLVIKDLTLFFRNRFFALVSLLGLVAYTLLYFLMPRMVDETLELGLYAPELPPIIAAELKDEGIVIVEVDSEAALKAAMDEGDLDVGAVLPADFLSLLAAGNKAPLHLYFTSELPQELREAYVILFEEVAFLLSGQSLNIADPVAQPYAASLCHLCADGRDHGPVYPAQQRDRRGHATGAAHHSHAYRGPIRW
jgi:ABC-2 type transport system permease protein